MAKASVISIDLRAGTAQFTQEMERTKAKIREFGAMADAPIKASASKVAATVKLMEGNLGGATKTLSKFLAGFEAVGPVVNAAFPVVGVFMLGKAIFETAEKVHEFFKSMEEAPKKIANAFRELNAPLRMTNDELRVANDRLENEIAKLEGRRQNTLKLALDEARVAADKLAESLKKDLDGLSKLLKEQEVGFWRGLFGAQATTKDITKEFGGSTGLGGFPGRVREINEEGYKKISAATTAKEKDAAQTELNTRLLEAYGKELEKVNGLIEEAERLSKPQSERRFITSTNPITGQSERTEIAPLVHPARDEEARLELLRGVRGQLEYERSRIQLTGAGSDLTAKKEALTAAGDNRKLDKPFADKIRELDAQIAAVTSKLQAAGMNESAQVAATGYAAAVRAIDELNRKLEENHGKLTEDQEAQIRDRTQKLASIEAETKWKDRIASTTDQIRDRIAAQKLLSEAIGRGYSAQRASQIETGVMGAVGAEKYNDKEWMAAHAGDVASIRAKIGEDIDAARAARSAEAVDSLGKQISLEERLAEAQAIGEQQIRAITVAEMERKLRSEGATEEEIKAEVRLFYARQRTADEASIARTRAETDATRALAAAQLDGAEAARKQALENKYAEMERTGRGAEVPAERAKDEADQQAVLTGRVAERINVYRNHLEQLDQERDRILEIVSGHTATLEQEIALRSIEDERLRVLRDQQLALGTARAGMRAFFLEMGMQARKTSEVVHEALTSAFERTSDSLARLLTGQKADWGQMFKDIGFQIVKAQTQTAIQAGVKKLGGLLGIKMPGNPTGNPGDPIYTKSVDGPEKSLLGLGRPAGTALDPIYVVTMQPGQPAAGKSAAAGSGSSIWGTVIGAILGTALKALVGGGGGGTPSVTSTIDYGGGRAAGGEVYPGMAYVVGENGPEILAGARGRILSNAESRRAFGGPTYYLSIDARGADAELVYQRTERAIIAAHNSAVGMAERVRVERASRSPQRR